MAATKDLPNTLIKGEFVGSDGTKYDFSGSLLIATYYYGHREAYVFRRAAKTGTNLKYEYLATERREALQFFDHEPTRTEVADWMTCGAGAAEIVR